MKVQSLKISTLTLWLTLLSCQTTMGVSGTWSGQLESPNKVGVQFAIEEKGGVVTGRAFWEESKTKGFEVEGQISGTLTPDGKIRFTTEGEVEFSGEVLGNVIKGTVTFPAFRTKPAYSYPVTLAR